MKIAVFVFVALLSGCATTSDVVPMGRDSYMVTVGSHTADAGNLKINAVRAANAYCAKSDKFMIVRNIESVGAAPAQTGSGSIIFSCVWEGDPEYQRPNLRPAATTVIEDARH
jgi:hypothetical protein